MPMKCVSLILAAGLGTRMKSDSPKVILSLGERPMLRWSIDACREVTDRPPYVVVGPAGQGVRNAIGEDVELVLQERRLGTGHAVMQAETALRGQSDLVLVTYADMPLLQAGTLLRLIQGQENNSGPLTMLVARSAEARGFGRVIRNDEGRIQEIVEEAVAAPEQLAGLELNVGAYCFRADWLWDHLPSIGKSAAGEYYLTDLIGMAVVEGHAVTAIEVADLDEIIGINTLEHLAEAEAALRKRINRGWMLSGVRMLDPSTTYISPAAEIGAGTVILPNTHIRGNCHIGEGCVIGPNSVLREATIGDRCRVEGSWVERAILEQEVEVGPFARLRPGARLGAGVHVGNFGEIKNSTLGAGVKVGHFSYLGDATIGRDVNIGAGTITCNFDGKHKHATEIEDGAFIGSDTMLVAPVRVGKGARTGAGSVVTRDVPAHTLAAGIPARAVRRLNPDD